MAWIAPIPVAALWIGHAAFDGNSHSFGSALVAATPGIAARLLGLSVLAAGLVGASLAASGSITAVAAWGAIELIGSDMTASLWRDAPGAEIAVAMLLGAFGGWAVIVSDPAMERDTPPGP